MIQEVPTKNLVSALSEALSAGHRAIVVMVAVRQGGARDFLMRTTPVSASDLHEAALFLVERAIGRAEHLADGSGGPVLPHLRDAAASLYAATAAVEGASTPTIGRA